MKSINENGNGKTPVAGLSRRKFLGITALGTGDMDMKTKIQTTMA